jgi:hypothetical protein|tara:strand:+ start:1091 stop:1561 length:471 start_codon:yes stop_codon:yes gene_type:complete
MPYTTTEGRALPMDKAFTHNNISFSANWLRVSTPADKEAQGISWVAPEEPPVVRAPLDREKSNGIAQAKDTAGKMLAQSDWMVIASVERSRVVADEWAEYRAAVIAEADRLEGEYNAAATYTDIDLIKQNWPLNPDEQAERDRMEAEEKGQEDGGV